LACSNWVADVLDRASWFKHLPATLDEVAQAIRQIGPGVASDADRSGLVNEADFAAQGR
jgi:hypothetical protein